MNKNIKKQWLKALRSGEYTRGVGQLRDKDNKFCCLGVLCNLHAQAHPEIAAEQTDTDSYLGASGLLPIAVAEWAEFKLSDIKLSGGTNGILCDIKTHPEGDTLSGLNDNWSSNFEKVADAIEAFL